MVKFFPSDTVQSVTLEVTDSLGLIDTQTQTQDTEKVTRNPDLLKEEEPDKDKS